MVKPFSLKAYAKINWFLSVGRMMPEKHPAPALPTPPSPRGAFHKMHTFYQLIDLYDEVIFRPGEKLQVVMEGDEIPENINLVTKELRLLQEHAELPRITISIKKRIPLQAGLGGGSSDAGTVLWCLQNVFRLPVSENAFWDIARVLGSDVPFFFLRVSSALGSGRGDILQPVPPLPPKVLVVAKPEAGMSTEEAYRRLDEAGGGTSLPFPSSFETPHNDFDRVALPESLNLMKGLRDAGARHVHLCGSGSAVFGEFPSYELASQVVERIREGGAWAHVCKTITSPEGVQWMDSF